MQTNSSAAIVIAAYKPKPGKEADLLQLTREHVPLLRAEGLVTDRPVTACQAKDGTIVEVFEWVAGGMERAHTNPAVNESSGSVTSPPATTSHWSRCPKRPVCSHPSPLSHSKQRAFAGSERQLSAAVSVHPLRFASATHRPSVAAVHASGTQHRPSSPASPGSPFRQSPQ
jgi:hypothetical protein